MCIEDPKLNKALELNLSRLPQYLSVSSIHLCCSISNSLMAAAAFQFLLSSSFLQSSSRPPIAKPTPPPQTLRRLPISSSSADTPPPSPSTTTLNPPPKKHWKIGEYPGVSQTSTPQFSTNNNNNNNKRRTPIKNIKKKLDRKNVAKAWANTVTESLSEAIDKKQWLRALQVFGMLKMQPFYQPKEGTYMKLLVLLGRSGQPGQACQLFDEMLGEGLEPTSELYTALLAACCRSNLIDKAFNILGQMKSLPLCQPDVYTYSILIKACVDARRFEMVESLYDEMSERLIVPNTVTQNIVLSGYGKAGKYEEMEKILSRMLDSTASKPDVWTMNTIISLFGNEGQIEMMERWYEKFRNFGIEPETRTFNILIGAYGKKRMYDKMSSVMEYMRRLSFPWTISTYNNLIEAFSDVGDAKHMEYAFNQMRGEGMKGDTKTFCCLIRGYANAGMFHKVVSSVELAGRLEIPENTSFFNAVLYACTGADDLMEMERVFKRMKEKGCQPNSATYSIMMDAYRKEGMNDKVYDLEQEQAEQLKLNANAAEMMMEGKQNVEIEGSPDGDLMTELLQ
ncbi:pentatricopeptide repeat-containing protein At3g06430, chloroplastic [Andrographis paniculata]|uniref:pentatricopeptide repeat-containing protein At3g06430, chloroplastic n=1 Tax=Andrographis paniculata TaxID=175694 RepID=UPI0021E97EBA|nr:pentatricopeptide repeat-containing protein At3g06430, chloroplastic [Andrographis paniculata]